MKKNHLIYIKHLFLMTVPSKLGKVGPFLNFVKIILKIILLIGEILAHAF